MKRFFSLCLVAFFCAACGPDDPAAPDQPQDYSGGHSAMNSIDYMGSYTPARRAGTEIARLTLLPYGECRAENASGTVAPCTYQWDVTGTVITLLMEGRERARFFVGEGYIKQVDGDEPETVYEKEPGTET